MDLKLHLRMQFNNKIRLFLIKDKCEHCSRNEELHLHHDGKSFAEMFYETHEELGLECKSDTEEYDKDKLTKLENIMLGKQIRISYLTLCKDCHFKLHKRVGKFRIKKEKVKPKKNKRELLQEKFDKASSPYIKALAVKR